MLRTCCIRMLSEYRRLVFSDLSRRCFPCPPTAFQATSLYSKIAHNLNKKVEFLTHVPLALSLVPFPAHAYSSSAREMHVMS